MPRNLKHLIAAAAAPGGASVLSAVIGDQTKLDADDAAIAAATAAKATDTTQQSIDQTALAQFVTANGPIFVLSADKTVATIVLPEPQPPGYMIVSANQAT